jgi:hypothetical protein
MESRVLRFGFIKGKLEKQKKNSLRFLSYKF